MYTVTHYVVWLLAAIVGVVFGIFFASSLDLHQPLYIFLLAGLFAIIFVIIACKSTKFFINRISGRMTYLWAGLIVLAAMAASAFLLFEAYR